MSELSNLNLSELAASVVPIVERAGKAVMQVYERGEQGNQHIGMQTKSDDSPVTAADLEANRILVEGLTALTPDIAVVSEEEQDSHERRQPTGLFWLLDPVDGTREFLLRTDEFTVNVALIADSIAVLGVVQAPALDQMYWGGQGVAAQRSDRTGTHPIRTAPFPARDSQGQFETPLRIMASRNHMNAATKAHIAAMQPHTVVGVGSSLKFCRIAEGAADYYPRLGPTSEWDTAAAQAVIEAAGGQVLTLSGEPLRYGKTDVLNPYFEVTAASA
jgi:3'(2'), 5'-bisphosphate nucleotidase